MTLNFLTVQQAAEELNLSVRAVQHRIRTGTLAATKLDPDRKTSAYVITREEVDRAKAAAQAEATATA